MKKIWRRKQRVFKAGLFAATVLTVVLLTITQVFAEALINFDSGNKVYTNADDSVDIHLSGVADENAAFFSKTSSAYSFSSYQVLGNKADSLTINETWAAYVPKVYYIALTDYTAAELADFVDLSDTDTDDSTVTLVSGLKTLTLQIITVIYDPDEPEKPTVTANYVSKTETELSVSAHDAFDETEENASGIALYSFDGGANWQPSNSKSFTSSQDVEVCVQDAAGNVSDILDYTVELDNSGPEFNVSVDPDAAKTSDPWQLSATVTIAGATDARSGLAAKPYSFDGGSSWDSSASTTVTSSADVEVHVKDALGNISIKKVQPKIDDIPPIFGTVTMSKDVTATGDWERSTTITINDASDEDRSGLATEPYSFDGGASWQAPDSKVFESKGTVAVCVKDNLGNISDTHTYVLAMIDRAAPTISDVTVSPDVTHAGVAWATSAAITVSGASDNGESGLASAPYSFNGGTSWQSDNTFTVTQNGNYTVLVRDALGNTLNAGTLNIDQIDTVPPVLTINESSISTSWATGTATAEFTVTDSGVGYNQSNISGSVKNGSVAISKKAGTDDTYIATITCDTDAVVEDYIILTAADKLGNSTGDKPSANKILIDNTAPVISVDESTIASEWNAASAVFEFTASDTGSGVQAMTGSVTNGTVAIALKTGSTYTATITASSGSVVNGNVELTITDGVYHSTKVSTVKPVKADAQDATLTDMTVQKISGSANPEVVKDGDIVQVSFKLTDAGSGVNTSSVAVTLNGASKSASNIGDVFTCRFTAGSDFAAADDSLLRITKIDYADTVGNSVTTAQNTVTPIKYYADIAGGFSELKFWSSNADSTVAKNGDTIYISFFTTHPVSIESGTISQSLDTNITWLKQNDTSKKSGSYYTEGCYTVFNDNAYDMQNVKLALAIGDAAENTRVMKTQADAASVTYYAPMSVSGVTIASNNAQDSAQYAKNADTVTVTFATNHDVSVSAASLAGKPMTPAKTDRAGLVKNWAMSYTLANGDLSDLSVVPFTFTISDRAGNEQIALNNGSPGVLHTLRYYAPITASTSVSSNYKYANYAKNSDTVTVAAKTNHAATIVSSAICGRKAGSIGSGSTNLKMSYQLPSGESSIAEGAVSLNYTVSDAAGNTLTVNKTNDSAGSSVTYDRTNPVVSVDPSSLSFSASTITYTVTFEDEHLSGQDISVLLNGKEQMTSRDRSSVSGTRYTKSVALSTDGNYKLVASLLDSAGNASDPDASTSVTVDMTKPEIKAVQLDTNKPKAFKAGFRISNYFEFVDQNIRDIICTVSDSEGTRDWDINEPLTGDGKKTINLIVTDMADNSSTSITYDLYIDGTAPKPVIIDTLSQSAVSADQPAAFVSEMELSIGLESLQLGEFGGDDHFTKIELYKGDALTADILHTVEPDENGAYAYSLKTFGNYNLVLSAADDVGNETGDLNYHFSFNDKNIFQKLYENTPLFVIVISILVIGIAALITLKIVKRNRQGSTANSI